MKSAGNRSILNGNLPEFHMHILLVAPLGPGHKAQSSTGQHEGGVTVRETAYHTSAAANIPVQSLEKIVGADASPVSIGEIAISKSLSNASSTFLAISFGFTMRNSSTTALTFSRAVFLIT